MVEFLFLNTTLCCSLCFSIYSEISLTEEPKAKWGGEKREMPLLQSTEIPLVFCSMVCSNGFSILWCSAVFEFPVLTLNAAHPY